jgi:bacterioferritin-associated ferredoxin
MYICICHRINEECLKNNPEKIEMIGTNCGLCIKHLKEGVLPGTKEAIGIDIAELLTNFNQKTVDILD